MYDSVSKNSLKIAVGIATTGRPEILLRTIGEVQKQSRAADRIVVCPARADDCMGLAEAFPDVQIIEGGRGLPRQRNAILKSVTDCDVILFLDDDFIVAPDYLEALETLFTANPDIIMATGHVIADGARNEGLGFDEGLALVAADTAARPERFAPLEAREGAYGCNMAIRLAPVFTHDVRFDERLPLYGWLEDIDFSGRLNAAQTAGRVVAWEALRGVHLGSKSGRQSGVRLGYSQMVNPVYISRKGALPRKMLYNLLYRNLTANVVKSVRPEPYIDRAGRLKGNMLGLWDILRGKEDPEKIETLG
ncbi:MAG: glycosyltransferase [Pseudomonadota bacterium]